MKHFLAYFLLVFVGARISHVCYCPLSRSELFAQFHMDNSSTHLSKMAFIPPIPFWETGWSYPIEGLVIALIVFLSIHYRMIRNEKLLSDEKMGLLLNIIHKMHTPLTLIQNMVDEIAARELPESASKDIRCITGHIAHVIERYRNVMSFDKMEKNMHSGTPAAEFELYAYITSITNQCRTYARTNQVQLKVDKSPEYIRCRINEITMTAALQCLVEQMIDATPQEGCVNIKVSHLADSWSLGITNYPDSGRGSFNMFQQLYALLSVHYFGSLRLVRRIIRSNGGKMTGIMYKHAVVFQVTIPLGCSDKTEDSVSYTDCAANEDEIVKEKSLPKSDKASHVLLVMTDKELSGYLDRTLSELFRVSILEDTKDISETFNRRYPDAIIIDETVNGIFGDELCSGIKSDANTCNIPVILLAHINDDESYLAHLRCGADKLEHRMINTCRLKADIRSLINNYAAQRKQFRKFIVDNPPMNLPEVAVKDNGVILFMEKLQGFLEKNLSEEGYSVKKLVLDMGMSRTKFYNKLTEVTGKAPEDYILSFKMDKAKTLLITQKHNVEEVATLLGYSSGKYFGKKFKKFYHVSPTQFVKNSIG